MNPTQPQPVPYQAYKVSMWPNVVGHRRRRTCREKSKRRSRNLPVTTHTIHPPSRPSRSAIPVSMGTRYHRLPHPRRAHLWLADHRQDGTRIAPMLNPIHYGWMVKLSVYPVCGNLAFFTVAGDEASTSRQPGDRPSLRWQSTIKRSSVGETVPPIAIAQGVVDEPATL